MIRTGHGDEEGMIYNAPETDAAELASATIEGTLHHPSPPKSPWTKNLCNDLQLGIARLRWVPFQSVEASCFMTISHRVVQPDVRVAWYNLMVRVL